MHVRITADYIKQPSQVSCEAFENNFATINIIFNRFYSAERLVEYFMILPQDSTMHHDNRDISNITHIVDRSISKNKFQSIQYIINARDVSI